MHLLNVSPIRAVMNNTPDEASRAKKPKVSHLKVFCCIAYALVNTHPKLDENRVFSLDTVFNTRHGKVIISREGIWKFNVPKGRKF